ncbi:MAG TPA: formyltransferase [Gemmatimonadaceae bacterium]|jgi:methionyl-tRNA formyltransferase|nr:formyltransferase [Gemmatimonadaceae bacterium]
MPEPRIVVFAYSDVGHACLEYLLAAGTQVVGCATHADAPGETIWFPSVRALADAHGIPVLIDVDVARTDLIAALAPDLVLSFYYRALLPRAVLALPRLGAFNMHGSLLPAYRGRAPVNWAVLRGETRTGATLHVMTPRADAGDIVDQEAVPIGPDDTAAQVQARVRDAATVVLARQLHALLEGRAPRRPQDESRASTFGRRRPADGAFDWTMPAARIHDLVRAVTHPYPGATTLLGAHPVHVWQTRLTHESMGGAAPGTFELRGGMLRAACGDGQWLGILRAQLDGDTERGGDDLARRLDLLTPHSMR